MNVVILCEGSSDAAFLGHYMMQAEGFVLRAKNDLPSDHIFDIRAYDGGRIWMYDAGQDHLAIWAANGITRLANASARLMENSRNGDESTHVDAVALVMDYDSEAEAEQYTEACLRTMNASGMEKRLSSAKDQWCSFAFEDGFGKTFRMIVTAIWIPLGHPGAMESFLMDALRKKERRTEYLAEQSDGFVEELVKHRTELPEDYLQHRRDQVKAPLAVYFAIASPNRMMQRMSNIIESVDWTKYGEIQTAFARLSLEKIRNAWIGKAQCMA